MDIPSGDAAIRGRFFPSQKGAPIATLLINFRGVQQTGGTFSYANALADFGAAVTWLRNPITAKQFPRVTGFNRSASAWPTRSSVG